MRRHKLKTWPEPFRAILERRKKHEFRNNDRGFELNDILVLHEWNPDTERFSGHSLEAKVTYIAYGPEFGIPEGYAVMSIEVVA